MLKSYVDRASFKLIGTSSMPRRSMPRRLLIIYMFCCVVLNLPISVSNAEPVEGQTYALDVFNSFAYLGVGQQLVVFDVIDPRAPVQVAEVGDLGDSVQDIQVIGERRACTL
jgi:hypothetical protein